MFGLAIKVLSVMKKGIKSFMKKATASADRLVYGNTNFVVISNNCWGGEIYRRLGMQYNTPFIGLYIYGPDYIKLLKNLAYYLSIELSFVETSKWLSSPVSYPVGVLDDVELHFVHYENKELALAKWNRRLKRMNEFTGTDKYFFKIDDRDLSDENIIMSFHNLPYRNKVSFGVDQLNAENHFRVEEFQQEKTVPDGVALYAISFKYFDVLKWVTTGRVTSNLYSKVKAAANLV